jgi:23S rRNA (adenine2030-N6)-methyltransferase
MLSYQHIYHAGNLADVHKHALMAFILDYLIQKEKPLTYMETHAGRGLYELDAPEARKTGEAAQGILRLEDRLPKTHAYRRALDETRKLYGAQAYPGSPMLAALLLRQIDAIHLAELHPQEYAALAENLAPHRVLTHKRDGLEMAMAMTPPTPRRGVLLIDPSYEVKEDYETIPKVIGQIARKWNVGTIALWYPILTTAAHLPMRMALTNAHPEALCHEVMFPPAREGHGMIGSGMFVINAPWGSKEETSRLSAIFAALRR